MTPPGDPTEDQERALGELFEKTATPPGEGVMHRLETHAAEIARDGVRQRWLTSRIVWPLAVAAAVAAAYLVVAPSKQAPVAVVPAPVPTVQPAPPIVPTASPAPDEEEADDVFAALEDPSLSDPFDLSPLMEGEL